MALEDAILKLAEAINRHTDVTAGAKVNPHYTGDVQPEKTIDVVVREPAAKKTTAKTTSSASAVVDTMDTTPETASTTQPDEETIDVNVLKEKFQALVEKDIAKAKEVLTEVGFAKFNLIPANLHAKLQELVDGALNG